MLVLRPVCLQRPQKVQQILLLLLGQMVVVVDHAIGFRAGAGVLRDGLYQVLRAAVVQEEDALAQSPQWCGAEFIRSGAPLNDVVRQSRTHVMYGEIGEEIRLDIAQSSVVVGDGGLHAGRVAECAADAGKQAAAVLHVLRTARAGAGGPGLLEKAHVVGKLHRVAHHGGALVAILHFGVVLGCGIEQAIAGRRYWSIAAFVGELLVADAHFHAAGFGGKLDQRLVLRLPAKARDGAVVGTAIEMAADAERGLLRRVGLQVGDERRLVNVLDESRTEHRRWNASAEIVEPVHLIEIRLRHAAGLHRAGQAQDIGGVHTAFDREHVVHAAIALGAERSVGLEKVFEVRLAYRTIGGDEEGQRVGGSVKVGHGNLRIGPDVGKGVAAGTGSTGVRLRVTAAARIAVVARTEADDDFAKQLSAHGSDFPEAQLAVLKEAGLAVREAGNGVAGANGRAAGAGIVGHKIGVDAIPECGPEQRHHSKQDECKREP